MLKKFHAVALAAALISVPALALADVGFEGGSFAGYSVSGNGSHSVVTTLDYVFTAADYGFDAAGSVGPKVGSYFGAFTALGDPSDPYTITYTFAAPTTTSDVLYLGLITADAIPAADDSVQISLEGTAGTYFNQTFKASDLVAQTGYYPFTDWVGVQVAAGTTSFKLTLKNDFDNANPPTLVVDYYKTPAAPVPEAGSVAMFVSGLGVVGLIARRRRQTA